MPTVIQLEPFSHILAALMDGVSSLTYAKKHDMRHVKYSDYAAFLRCSKAMWELGRGMYVWRSRGLDERRKH